MPAPRLQLTVGGIEYRGRSHHLVFSFFFCRAAFRTPASNRSTHTAHGRKEKKNHRQKTCPSPPGIIIVLAAVPLFLLLGVISVAAPVLFFSFSFLSLDGMMRCRRCGPPSAFSVVPDIWLCHPPFVVCRPPRLLVCAAGTGPPPMCSSQHPRSLSSLATAPANQPAGQPTASGHACRLAACESLG